MHIYRYLVYDEKDLFEREVQGNKDTNLYLALQAAILRNFVNAKSYLAKIDEAVLSDAEKGVFLEIRALMAYGKAEFELAKGLAQEAILKDANLFFSHSILALMAEMEKRFTDAMTHYKIILNIYQNHDRILLNMTRIMLFLKQDYKEILKIVRGCKPSLRRNLYLYLIPLGKPLTRMIFFIVMLGLFTSTWGNILFWVLLTSTLLILIYSVIKLRLDVLILTRIVFLQVMIIMANIIVTLWRTTI